MLPSYLQSPTVCCKNSEINNDIMINITISKAYRLPFLPFFLSHGGGQALARVMSMPAVRGR
jgi:hypothetical protein